MKRVNYYLSEKQIEELKIQSKKTGISVSEIIRRAIDDYFKRNNNDN